MPAIFNRAKTSGGCHCQRRAEFNRGRPVAFIPPAEAIVYNWLCCRDFVKPDTEILRKNISGRELFHSTGV
jgi:hypothetical protein